MTTGTALAQAQAGCGGRAAALRAGVMAAAGAGAEVLAASVRDFVSGQQDGRAAEVAAGTARGRGGTGQDWAWARRRGRAGPGAGVGTGGSWRRGEGFGRKRGAAGWAG